MPPVSRIVSLVSRLMGTTARAFGRRQGVEILRCSLIASLRTRAAYVITVVAVAAAIFEGMPRPLASAIASELPERPPFSAQVVRAGITPSDAPPVSILSPTEAAQAALPMASTPATPSPAPERPGASPSAEAAVSVEPTSFWAKTKKETAIWSGWDSKAVEFAKIGPEIVVQVFEHRGSRAYVYFPGDAKGHKPGEVWVDRADLEDMSWPRWARARRATSLRAEPSEIAGELLPLARGHYVETTGETQGRWAQAFFLLDRQPGEWAIGWVDGRDLTLPRGDQAEISTYMLTRAALMASQPDLWLKVPYRTQLDGSAYAEANCGPTSIAMALEAIGKRDTLESLRTAALQLQDMNRCDDCGTYIQHLASVAEARGAKTYNLRDDPESFHRWTLDEIRQQLREGRVVIPQVKFRLLPGRGKAPYGGDHYIVIAGLSGNDFIYNDPIDSDGRGYGRLITAEQLEQAMSSATAEYARTAFAVGR